MTRDVSDVTHGGQRGLRFEKSQLVEIETWARPDQLVRYRQRRWEVGADGKVSIKRLYLSPYVEKPLNSEVIKSSVPELSSRKYFSCFGIPMLYICALWTLWTFCILVCICTFRISASRVCYICSKLNGIARLEFELAYFMTIHQYVNPFTFETPLYKETTPNSGLNPFLINQC